MTKIEWTHRAGTKGVTWNPIRARNKETGGTGHFCEKVSAGCKNCYAETFQKRFKNPIRYAAQDVDKVEVFLDDKTLLEPLKWRKPRTVFVCSQTDLFLPHHKDQWIDQVFAVMALCPQHTFIVLTKRQDRMLRYTNRTDDKSRHPAMEYAALVAMTGRYTTPALDLRQWPLPNLWLGVSVEDQETANDRIPTLILTPATVRFISVEPLLGSINLKKIQVGGYSELDSLAGTYWNDLTDMKGKIPAIDWVIVGGESGNNARPMHPDWVRSLRDQCKAVGVPFFFKQWGAWATKNSVDCYCHGPDRNKREHPNSEGISWLADGRICYQDFTIAEHARRVRAGEAFNSRAVEVDKQAISDFAASLKDENRKIDNPVGYQWMYRVGKKAAGRLLDGVEYNEWPAADQWRAEA